MKIIFAGTPDFAVPSLQALLTTQHEIQAVYTQPDRAAGRGQRCRASPIKALALAHNLTLRQPISLKEATVLEALQSWKPDVMIIVAYGLMISTAILKIPTLGCINVHASLLPRWRGAAPIARAIQAGDSETGITMMQMDKGLDTGPILLQQQCPIEPQDTAQTLQVRLAQQGALCLLNSLNQLPTLQAAAKTQNNALSSYAKKLYKSEGLLNWHEPALLLHRHIRAFNPWPVAFTFVDKLRLRIWKADIEPDSTVTSPKLSPGTIVSITDEGILTSTGQGYLRITQLQQEGKRPVSIAELRHGKTQWLKPGIQFK